MKILFHHPLPLNPNANSASGIRPLRMLEAFRSLGYEIDLVTGYAKERKAAINKAKENIKKGKRYEFMYAESSTMPTILTETHHLPTHPLMDWFFFRFCKKHAIPIGLFYRDIYWKFDSYRKSLSWIEAQLAVSAYQFDLWWYQKTLTKLYLPSMGMAKYIPRLNPARFDTLPPGHAVKTRLKSNLQPPLKIFYVGGISDHYQMHKLFSVLRSFPDIQFTLCTREAEWLTKKDTYPLPTSNIRVIHAAGKEMEKEVMKSDIAALFVKPQKYWEFAVPFKLFEYLGYKKPILASNGTLAGKFVAEHAIGWSIDYDEKALTVLLGELLANPNEIIEKQELVEKVAPMHSWQARAKQVVRDLTL